MNLDERDRRLLALLQQDCRLSNAELGEKVGMSTSACWRRVRAFEQAGIIDRYSAVLRPEAITAFIRSVSTRREVQECYATTGAADYHLRVVCADIDAYNRFLEEFLFRLPAVRSAQTNVVLKEVKRSAVLEF